MIDALYRLALPRPRNRAAAAVLLPCLFTGCAATDGRQAEQGRSAVIGYTQDEMRMCAGFPNQTLTHDDAEIWSYKRQSTPSGGLTVSTPLSVVPGFSQSANIGAPVGTCSMQVRFVHGKVVEVAYAGDTDVAGIRHAYCAPLISNCLSYRPAQGH